MSHSAQLATVASVRQVRLRYRDVIALDGIDLDIPAGRMVGLIGPDGVGKSSLLLIAGGCAHHPGGHGRGAGWRHGQQGPSQAVCPRIAYMPQGLGKNLYPTLSVEENLQFFARLFGHGAAERRRASTS
jgi:ribosome-dependent ATPase